LMPLKFLDGLYYFRLVLWCAVHSCVVLYLYHFMWMQMCERTWQTAVYGPWLKKNFSCDWSDILYYTIITLDCWRGW